MKYSKVIMLLAAVALSAMGCSKDDDKTQAVVQEPEVVADNVYQFKVLDGQALKKPCGVCHRASFF